MSTSFQDENYKIVHVGPEMTPEMREGLHLTLEKLVLGGVANALNPNVVHRLIEDALDTIEQVYLGIGKAALKDIQKVIEERNES